MVTERNQLKSMLIQFMQPRLMKMENESGYTRKAMAYGKRDEDKSDHSNLTHWQQFALKEKVVTQS